MLNISYDEARKIIQDGDIISFLRPSSKVSITCRIITAWTQSPIYHTGIAVWLTNGAEKRLFVVEAMDKTRRITPLSFYQKTPMHVLAKPDIVKFELFAPSLLERASSASYSFLKAVQAGIRQYLKLPYISLSTGEICSELAAKSWKLGGMDIKDTMLDPCQLEKMLIEDFGVQYRCMVNI